MKSHLLAGIAATSLLAGCAAMTEPLETTGDPVMATDIPEGTGIFAQPSNLPFHAPDFSTIRDSDYKPAIEQGLAIHKAEIEAIKANPAAPSFANTIVALEESGQMLNRVLAVFYAVVGANTNDTLDAIDAEISPKLAAHYGDISLDPVLFARVKAVYDNRAAMSMTPEDAVLLEETYEQMVHAGALLDEGQKAEIKQINTRLSELSTDFSQKLTQATKDQALVVADASALAGLSASEIESARAAARDRGVSGYVIPLQNTTQQPSMPALDVRATRQQLFTNSYRRTDRGGSTDTRANLAEQAALRARKAQIFGLPNWASYQMYDNMAKEPQTALDFMGQLTPALAATQRREAGVLNQAIRADGGDFTVRPWDWDYYAEMVRKERYDLDEEAVKPYFEVDRVLEDGVFFMAEKLYGITFTKRSDIPVYHPTVSVYTVYDADGSELGLFYFDPFQRDNKRGGAWMSNFVEQSKMAGTKPVIYNVLNIAPPADGEPALASFDNVITMFHEFGHAVHGLFANQRYASLSGTAVARDFVEYPSQVHEMWATWPEVLQNYAKHYQTGETIPQDLIDKIEAASKFNQGYSYGETVTAALLDMKWHSLSAAEAAAIDTPAEVDAYEAQALAELGLETDLVPPRYRSSYFRHIFAGGYSAGYYAYLWTGMLDHDSRQWFRENGGLTRANGDHYRATVLSQGGTKELFQMYRDFRGRDPKIDALLSAKGLDGSSADAEADGSDETGG
ncbi:M3 family metallopeptidase [Alteriqipengyuania flavescens]|uniref:M3 family metallopeptidase n=1 Tax=Alteriqipengyuania flavescens TaxID=3053610 RepID=UPI0025B497EB|nr:M3 family metallopeptidase [Alteriqipengyuania flavescens]WJY17968.1 M3 family metallopeptidase [Alteriqipengyuania flavescens]WJY23909.1 M3 family metallopeptidase [Alteriqipengyuania flavescens]